REGDDVREEGQQNDPRLVVPTASPTTSGGHDLRSKFHLPDTRTNKATKLQSHYHHVVAEGDPLLILNLFRYALKLRPPPAPTLTLLASFHVPPAEGAQHLLHGRRRRQSMTSSTGAPLLPHRRHHLLQLLLGHHGLDLDPAALVFPSDDAPNSRAHRRQETTICPRHLFFYRQ
ncbi:unnamed protein product, partial [Musa banksii]